MGELAGRPLNAIPADRTGGCGVVQRVGRNKRSTAKRIAPPRMSGVVQNGAMRFAYCALQATSHTARLLHGDER